MTIGPCLRGRLTLKGPGPTSKLVIKLDHAYNPAYLLNNELVLYPLPSSSWDIAKPGGPRLDYAAPANAKRIYDFLSGQGGRAGTFATDQLWKTVDGPFRLRSFSATDGSSQCRRVHARSRRA